MSQTQTKFVKVLDKGLITLPKSWRTTLKFTKGTILQAKQVNHTIVLEPILSAEPKAQVPYRIYSTAELERFLQDDAI